MNAPSLNKIERGYLKKFIPIINWYELNEEIKNGLKVFKLRYKNRPKVAVETFVKILEDGTIETVDEFGRTNYLQSNARLREIYDNMTEDKMVNNGWWNKTKMYIK